MSIPSWVRSGARCECVDGVWVNTFDIPGGGPYPFKGQRFTVLGSCVLLGGAYLNVVEQHVAPDWYAVDAFRPLTLEEQDAGTFDVLLKGASVARKREMEPAL